MAGGVLCGQRDVVPHLVLEVEREARLRGGVVCPVDVPGVGDGVTITVPRGGRDKHRVYLLRNQAAVLAACQDREVVSRTGRYELELRRLVEDKDIAALLCHGHSVRHCLAVRLAVDGDRSRLRGVHVVVRQVLVLAVVDGVLHDTNHLATVRHGTNLGTDADGTRVNIAVLELALGGLHDPRGQSVCFGNELLGRRVLRAVQHQIAEFTRRVDVGVQGVSPYVVPVVPCGRLCGGRGHQSCHKDNQNDRKKRSLHGGLPSWELFEPCSQGAR